MTEKVKKWSDEKVATLLATVGNDSPVSVSAVEKAAEVLGLTARSVASKLRQLDRPVASMAKEKVAAFSVEQGEALAAFVKANAGNLTYKDIAEQFQGGAFTAKQVQGKILALELTGSVKPADKIEVARTYTEAEEAKFIALVKSGAYIEDIAEALNKELNSVRGKALSLNRTGLITEIPKQKVKHAKEVVDVVASLGDKIATLTVEEIAKAAGKTDRGIKTLLTRRGLDCANYKGAAKAEKAAAKAAKATA